MKKIKFIFLNLTIIILCTLNLSRVAYAKSPKYLSSITTNTYIANSTNEYNDTIDNKVYDKLYDSIKNRDTTIVFDSSYTYNNFENIGNMWNKLIMQHLELVEYASLKKLTHNTDDNNNPNYIVELSYDLTEAELADFYKKIDNILNNITSKDMTDLQKELAIHDYIATTCKYGKSSDTPYSSYTASGCLFNHLAVCEGYAKAMNILLNRAGIKCITTGSDVMNHEWNIVTINGETYNVDCCWDSYSDSSVSYKYFNQSDEYMKNNHKWTSEDFHPDCNSESFTDFSQMTSFLRFGDTIFYTDAKHTTLYKADFTNEKPLNNVFMENESGFYSLIYQNGWIYYTQRRNYENIYRVNIDDPSKVETVISDSNADEINLNNGMISYINHKTQRFESHYLEDYNEYDLNGDSSVDTCDLAKLSKNYNKQTEFLFNNKNEDLNKDGIVDIYDMVKLSNHIKNSID